MSSKVIHFPPSLNSWRSEVPYRRKEGPLGLKNLGNTCYFNSVLQCLTYTPPLANFCLQGLHSSTCEFRKDKNNASCAFCLLERRIRVSLTVDNLVDSPIKILDCLQRSTRLFRVGRQEDAHELLRFAIDVCNSACVQIEKPLSSSNQLGDGKPKEEQPNIIKEIFGGVLQSQVKCTLCGAESNKLDDIMDLSLEMSSRVASLREALGRFFQSEILDGDNKYMCSMCKKPTVARKQLSVYTPPNVLVIQLKRFENIYGGKIDRYVAFEERLGLAGYMCRYTKDLRPEYALYGVVVHSGYSQDAGHYYAYIKESSGKWFCCNDAQVYQVSLNEVRSDKAYILFYLRNNSRPDDTPSSRSDSTPSPPTTPDTDIQEPPKKYTNTPPLHGSNGVLRKTNGNDRGSLKKPLRFQLKKVSDQSPPENTTPEEQTVSKAVEDGIAAAHSSDSKHLGCDSGTKHFFEERSSTLLSKGQSGGGTRSCRSPARFVADGKSSSSADIVKECDSPFELSGADVVARTEGHDSPQQAGNPSSILNSTGSLIESVTENTNPAGTKICRNEDQVAEVNVETAEIDTVVDIQIRCTTERQVSSTGDGCRLTAETQLKSSLKRKIVDELRACGWCDNVKERLRLAKRMKITSGLWNKDSAKVAFESGQLFAEERGLCKEEVPRKLKELLVEEMLSHFCRNTAN